MNIYTYYKVFVYSFIEINRSSITKDSIKSENKDRKHSFLVLR